MKKIRAGIIGCGFIANGKHLAEHGTPYDEIEVVAFCDLIIEKAQDVGQEVRRRRRSRHPPTIAT